ncbi:hypothetical protein U1Q18_001011 [Sarracenia purpurea var. burkii]
MEPTEPSSESLDPTEPLPLKEGFRWYRQRKDPACVVGEHRQLYFALDDFRRTVGDDGGEDVRVAPFIGASKFMCGDAAIFSFFGVSPILREVAAAIYRDRSKER